tara:strand:- start:44 stop:217 length:174 start_codon:yes stop_codon:yes gene_type:complete
MIEFKGKQGASFIQVLLDSKGVGVIKCDIGKYQYFPKGQKTGGEVFTTLEDCKNSLK